MLEKLETIRTWIDDWNSGIAESDGYTADQILELITELLNSADK